MNRRSTSTLKNKVDTGLAYIIHSFESVSVVSHVCRYFLRQHCVYGRLYFWISPVFHDLSELLGY